VMVKAVEPLPTFNTSLPPPPLMLSTNK
jgi:hypothetical protein